MPGGKKVALITGSSQGIGQATAERFHAAGANVVVNYFRSEREAVAVAEMIRADGGTPFLTAPTYRGPARSNPCSPIPRRGVGVSRMPC